MFSGNLVTEPRRAITEKWSEGKTEPILVGHFARLSSLVPSKRIKTAQKQMKNLMAFLFLLVMIRPGVAGKIEKPGDIPTIGLNRVGRVAFFDLQKIGVVF